MVCQFLLYNKVKQLYIYIYPHISSLLCLPPILPIPPLYVVTEHRAMQLLPTSYLFYIWQCIYVHTTLSLCPSLCFPVPVSSSPFSTSVSLFLSCPQVLQNHFFFLLCPLICRWTLRLLPCPGYCKQSCNEHCGTLLFLNYGFLREYAQQWNC